MILVGFLRSRDAFQFFEDSLLPNDQDQPHSHLQKSEKAREQIKIVLTTPPLETSNPR